MENCICSFQSATGLTNAVDFSGISNILYDEIKINSNYNFLFGSNINSNFGYGILHYSNINYLYASNINSNLSNNIIFSSNINFLYTSNLYHLFNGNGIETSSNISNLYYNTGFIDSNLLWWRYELQATQLEVLNQKASLALLSAQQNILSGTVSINSFTLIEHGARLDNLENDVNSLNNNTFTKEQTSNIFITSNVLDNTSNTLANYDNLYNKPSIFTQIETSNIFITSNVFSNILSNTSNTLANYDNLYNKPSIFSQIETSNIFITSNHINTNFYNKTQSDNRYYTKTQSDTNYYTKTQSDTNYYNKTYIDTSINSLIAYRPMTSNTSLKLTGSIYSLFLASEGSGYTPNLSNQPLTFTGGNGQNASGLYNTDASGSVSSITLTNAGVLYTNTNVQVKAGTGNAVINASMEYFNFQNVYSALNVSGKSEIEYKRCDLAFGTRDPTGISYQEDPDGNAYALGTNKFCGLRVKDDRVFLIGNSNLISTSFNNNFIGAYSNVKINASEGNVEIKSWYGDVKISGKTVSANNLRIDAGTIAKKEPKFFTTARTANFDGVNCLAFDIDLTKVSLTANIDGIDFRHFRIKIFFGSGRLDYQWTPRNFDISISTYNSFSLTCSEGNGYISGLDKAFSSDYFLYKQNFNLITFCAPTSIFGTTHLKICYVLEDLLGQ